MKSATSIELNQEELPTQQQRFANIRPTKGAKEMIRQAISAVIYLTSSPKLLQDKNTSFFRSLFGAAYIGDMFMSIIHTCSLMKVNAFDYLVALQKYSYEVFANPCQWMPWNYRHFRWIQILFKVSQLG